MAILSILDLITVLCALILGWIIGVWLQQKTKNGR